MAGQCVTDAFFRTALAAPASHASTHRHLSEPLYRASLYNVCRLGGVSSETLLPYHTG